MSDSSSLGGALIAAGACVLLLFCVIVLCASYCHRLDDDMLAIDSVDLRGLQLREDLVDTVLDAGRSEWQCLVCAHMNHPNHELCLLCGTSAEFSTTEETLEDTATNPATHTHTRRVARTTFLSLRDNATLLSSTLLENLVESSDSSDVNVILGDAKSTLHKAKTLPMLRSESSFGDAAQELEATTSMRQRALRYRRLNEMQLNQKQRGASRRRLWQRVPLPNGGFVWVRTMEPAAPGSVFARADSLVTKLRNNSFLAKNPQAKNLHGDLAEQLHRKNAASMGFFTELNSSGTAVAWRKTDSVALDVDPKGGEGEEMLDFEGVLAMTWREKKRWFLKQITNLAVPYTESMFKIDVRRSDILDDSVPQLAGPAVDKSRMQEHLNIGFIGEPALDAGGVLREWFGLVCKELFSAERGLFVTTHAEDSSYWINSESAKSVPEGQDHLQYFTFAGRLLGKAVLDGLVLEVSMSLPLLKHLLGVPITFSDLEYLDEELFKHLSWVRDNDHVDALCVTFSIQTPSGETVELKPGGSNIDVTDENKMEYLSLVLRYRMLDSVSDQLTALLKGLYEVIPKSLLTIFDYQELDFYLSGLPTLNVTDWQNNSRVRHKATDSDSEAIEQELEVVQWFWDVVGSFTDDQRARLLQFATGCSRVPVEGFKALTSASGIVHPFTLQLVSIGTPPLGMCPRAHTCFNRVDLPVYETKEDLKSYLSLVIQMEITGFGFE
ncbi:putative HECT E3 ubiquitin ligase [Phytophthora cinnamomi]|uniref:putative HECT E3 ubiquitin ligase n=1 Tax=Phytophthora cinnamomi TaxID=4785 RepID=UPI00355AB06D|nr:putative HECT E3 ubiquitin ligase [Phytophthora cinnamomi]